jgi:hypothetical protein
MKDRILMVGGSMPRVGREKGHGMGIGVKIDRLDPGGLSFFVD